jgi:hypothetical protein
MSGMIFGEVLPLANILGDIAEFEARVNATRRKADP